MNAFLAWIAVASAAAFLLAGWDKLRARIGARRVAERVLLAAALVGGTPGLLAGMVLFGHKTRKAAFLLPLAGIVAAQAALAYLWLSRP